MGDWKERHWLHELLNKEILDATPTQFNSFVQYVGNNLQLSPYLFGQDLTLADVYVWSQLFGSERWRALLLSHNDNYPLLKRWYLNMEEEECFRCGIQRLSHGIRWTLSEVKLNHIPAVDCYECVVAVSLKDILAREKEDVCKISSLLYKVSMVFNCDGAQNEAEESVIRAKFGLSVSNIEFLYMKSNLNLLMKKCSTLIKLGYAYIDEEPEHSAKGWQTEQRFKGKEKSIAENRSIWNKIKHGECPYNLYVRAKVDSRLRVNPIEFDPVLFRCFKKEVSEDKDWVFPSMKFATPIINDENAVTHVIYNDNDERLLYIWLTKILLLRRTVRFVIKGRTEQSLDEFGWMKMTTQRPAPEGFSSNVLHENQQNRSPPRKIRILECASCAELKAELEKVKLENQTLTSSNCPKCNCKKVEQHLDYEFGKYSAK